MPPVQTTEAHTVNMTHKISLGAAKVSIIKEAILGY